VYIIIVPYLINILILETAKFQTDKGKLIELIGRQYRIEEDEQASSA
jgi:hypothetical protein